MSRRERAAVFPEVGREEGKDARGRTVEVLENVTTSKDGPHAQPLDNGTWHAVSSHDLHGGLKNLANRSVVTGEGDAFCPNPNDTLLRKEYETQVHITQRYPEMKTIEETFYVKEVRNEERIVKTPRTRVVKEEHQRIDTVPVVKQVPKTRKEKVYRLIEEEEEVKEMVPVVEMVEVPRTEVVSRVVTYDHEERISVPVVVEVPRVRKVDVPTGKWCEAPAGDYTSPGHFNIVGQGHGTLKQTTNSSTTYPSSWNPGTVN